MITILMKDKDVLFRCGMQHYLSNLFFRRYRQQVEFRFDFIPEAVSQSDIIVIALVAGERYTCIPELQSRNKGIVVSILESECEEVGKITHCMKESVFIKRRDPLNVLSQKIIRQWELSQLTTTETSVRSCHTCHYKFLSPQQLRVMASLYHGCSMANIAQKMGVSDKTVFAHKYQVMHKFNLSSDYDLLNFLKTLKEKNTYPTLFEESLNIRVIPEQLSSSIGEEIEIVCRYA